MSKEIILSVKRGKFRSDDPDAEAANKEFLNAREEVLSRDKYKCVYCGFYAKKFQEVHHLDNDHTNNELDNLVTTCSLCHMCHHISFAGIKEMGTLIYIEPELEVKQAELNSLVRNLWLAEDSKNQEINSMAVELFFRLFFRSTFVKNTLGDANPTTLGNYLLGLPDDMYEKRKDILTGIYLLPSKTGFKKQYKYWKESYKGVMPGEWKKLAIQNSLKWYNIENDATSVSKREAVMAILERSDA